MARVIYTGPLNPVIFARAKKEAEKAERIKGYTPRVIKTPSHTVVYSKTGPEVKAVVMDMLAPITFSILGSAIPVRPSFLHLHPESPEKVYGRQNFATASGVVRGWGGGGGDYIGNNFNWGSTFPENESSYSINSSVRLSTDMDTQYMALSNYWDEGQGQVPSEEFSYQYVEQSGSISVKATIGGDHVSSSEFSGYSISTLSPSLIETRGNVNYSSVISLAVITKNIRDISFFEGGYIFVANRSAAQSYASFSYIGGESSFDQKREVSIDSCSIDCKKSIVIFSGDVANPAVISYNKSKLQLEKYVGSLDPYIANAYSHSSAKITQCVLINIANDMQLSRVVAEYDDQYNEVINLTPSLEGPEYQEFFRRAVSESGTEFDKHVFVAGSVEFDNFFGVLIWAKVYDSYPGIQKTQYQTESVFVQSNLAYYFDIFNGQYTAVDAPFWEPPDTTSDGICLPHAWFFVRENGTRQTDFYPNNHNRLSIVIYPQGRHEFSVDEAEIITVDLDHTPRFVASPGGAIAVSMVATNGGSESVPFTVSGLSQEFDDEGNPTGFYLADDGVLSGSFSGSGAPVVFKLSPRQSLPAYRTVTVVAETEREHGVSACFEVLGDGVRLQPGPPVITLERISESVLSGQTSAFCLTATHIAYGSQLKYEVRHGEDVVNTGFVTIVNGAGIVEYTAPFMSLSAGGSPVKYVLADRLAPSATPSTVEYEFAIIHDQAPEPKRFSVRFAHEQYSSASDRPEALPLPPMFYMTPTVSANGEDDFFQSNAQTTLVQRVWYSLKSKRVYVLFWDGRSCEVSNVLKQNPESGQYEFNPDWKEVAFDYPPAADPYNIKGTLEPYVYAYMEYANNLNNGA